MARKTSVDKMNSDLAKIKEDIAKFEAKIADLKEKEKDLTSAIEKEELAGITDLLTEKRMTVAQLKEIINNQ